MSEKPSNKLPETLKKLRDENHFNAKFWEQWDSPDEKKTDVYDSLGKYHALLKPLLEYLKQRNIDIGPVVVDVGAGRHPMSKYLLEDDGKKRTVFAVDFAKPYSDDIHHIRADVNAAAYPESFAYKRGITKIANALGIDPRSSNKQHADVLIFSEILNYVPYKEVLTSTLEFLKSGGVLIIFNEPGKTFDYNQHHLPPYGVQNNNDLMKFLSNPNLGLKVLGSNYHLLGMPDEEFAPLAVLLQKE